MAFKLKNRNALDWHNAINTHFKCDGIRRSDVDEDWFGINKTNKMSAFSVLYNCFSAFKIKLALGVQYNVGMTDIFVHLRPFSVYNVPLVERFQQYLLVFMTLSKCLQSICFSNLFST